MQYNLKAIENTVSRYVEAGTHKNLIARIGLDEFRNHVLSCLVVDANGFTQLHSLLD